MKIPYRMQKMLLMNNLKSNTQMCITFFDMFCRSCRFYFFYVLNSFLSKVKYMNLEYNKGVLFVRLSGYINHNMSYKINNILVPKILDKGIKYLVFNLYDVDDIDSFGLDALLNVKCAIKTNKGKICLCEIPDYIKKKIKLLKIIKVKNEINALDKVGEY